MFPFVSFENEKQPTGQVDNAIEHGAEFIYDAIANSFIASGDLTLRDKTAFSWHLTRSGQEN